MAATRPIPFPALSPDAPDAELLGRFVETRDEPAFAELVRRHGPGVYRVCRRLLGPAAADDAFQATFLVLACRARRVRKAGSVGSFLVGVAGRVARQMRRRSLRAGGVGPPNGPGAAGHLLAQGADAPCPVELADLARVLDDELTRLPDHLRGPVVVCLLQGRTQEQAVGELGVSVRTLRRRLDKAKRVLRDRLERRGVVPAVAAGLAAGVGDVTATVPPAIGPRTVALVSDFLAGGATAAPAAILAKGVAMGSLARKVTAAVAAAAVGLTAVGIGLAGDEGKTPAPDPAPASAKAGPPAAAPSGLIPPLNLPREPAAPPPVPPTITGGPDDRHETANFDVTAPTEEVARLIGAAAELHRKELARQWLGRELPAWPVRCSIRVELTAGTSGGASAYQFRPDGRSGLLTLEMKLWGELGTILGSNLPHEVMHTVLATHFGKALPRWADEGIAVQAESPDSRRDQDVRCRELLNQGRGVRLKVLLALKEYPRDMIVVYAQGYSVCQFLLRQKGKRPEDDSGFRRRRSLLTFIGEGMERGWDAAARDVYGFKSVDDLEEAWIDSLRQPPPAAESPKRPPAAPVPPEPDRPIPQAVPPIVSDTVPAGANPQLAKERLYQRTPSPAAVRAIAAEVEFQRRALARLWLGAELPPDRQKPITVNEVIGGIVPPPPVDALAVFYNRDGEKGSSTDFDYAHGQLERAHLYVSGGLEYALEEAIPNAVTRAVLAEHFGRQVPQWVVEGMAMMSDPPAVQDNHDRVCRGVLNAGRGLRLKTLFPMASYPKDSVVTYAQGHSVVRFLTTRNGPKNFQSVVRFVDVGTKDGWDKAVDEVYGLRSVDVLEAAWLDWLRTPPSGPAKGVVRPSQAGEPSNIPPANLPPGR